MTIRISFCFWFSSLILPASPKRLKELITIFSEKLREIMELRDMTATDLSRITGLSKATLSKWMNSKGKDPKLSTIKKIAEALHVSPEYFFGTQKEDILSRFSKEEQKLILSEEFVPWLKFIKEAKNEGITPEVLNLIVHLLKTFAQQRRR